MPLTEENIQITNIPMKDIYSDAAFNTRNDITPFSCIDLAKSIKQDGLLQPITIRPANEHDGCPPEFKYVIVAGHRRHMAYQINGTPTIPARVVSGLSWHGARKLNIIENLKRKELNLLEEANCVKHYMDEGYGREDIAEELGMSPGWVQIRQMVCDLPPEIQKECANGTFTAPQIRDLNSLKNDPQQQLIAARKLKEARQKGESKTADQVMKKPPKATTKKQRNPSEIKDMMAFYKETFGKFDITTRIMAWAVGEIDNAQVYLSISEECKNRGIEFKMPEMSI